MVNSNELHVIGDLIVKGQHLIPPKCMPPGGDKLQCNGTHWVCVCEENWSGETCETPPSPPPTPPPSPPSSTPIPDASWRTFVKDCLDEAPVTGECTEWASGNNYGTMPNWDTSLVEDMRGKNNGGYIGFGRKSTFNGDISRWNTAQVTDMSRMFAQASAFNQAIGSWNTTQVADMNDMFYYASAFNQAIGSWNTAQVTDMSRVFAQASVFNQDIGGWNTEKVTYMDYMFQDASAFNGDIGSWNTALVTNMNSMFSSASAFNQDISGWTGTAATSAQTDMFLGATAFQAKFTCTDAITGPPSTCSPK